MALNDQNRSRKTYSFFRAPPVPANRLVTLLSAGLGLRIEGDASQITYLINDGVVATQTGSNFFSGSNTFAGGLTGSLQQVTGGLSYLVAGVGIRIVSQSNGQVVVSNTSALADVSASYITIGNTGSLPNERALSASFGLLMTDNGAGSTVALAVNPNEVACLTGSTFRGPVSASAGLSGSLQEVVTGVPFLLAGRGIKFTSMSNGQILVASTTGSLVGSGTTTFAIANNNQYIIVSGAVAHTTMSLSDHPHNWQEHVFKDGDGKSPTFNIIISASAGMKIDGAAGTEITSSYGVRGIVFVGNNLWSVVASRP